VEPGTLNFSQLSGISVNILNFSYLFSCFFKNCITFVPLQSDKMNLTQSYSTSYFYFFFYFKKE